MTDANQPANLTALAVGQTNNSRVIARGMGGCCAPAGSVAPAGWQRQT